ncbi:MAG TPA: hypothetical protein VN808_14845 [Stellaceae bacterium]|nr:hypothetical protein [Stellaceae bacterium]
MMPVARSAGGTAKDAAPKPAVIAPIRMDSLCGFADISAAKTTT